MVPIGWRSLLLLVLAVPAAHGNAPNPPKCVTDITGIVAKLAEAARRLGWSTNECLLGWSSGWNVGIDTTMKLTTKTHRTIIDSRCAEDVSSVFACFFGAGKKVASAAFNCGGQKSGCAQQILAALTDVSVVAKKLGEGTRACQGDGYTCARDLADSAFALTLLAQNIKTGLHLCSNIDYVPPPPPGPPPVPQPNAPVPLKAEPNAASLRATPELPTMTYGDNIPNSMFPNMQPAGPAERRLAGLRAGLDPALVEAAHREQANLDLAAQEFRQHVGKVITKLELVHVLNGQALPEHFVQLRQRLVGGNFSLSSSGATPVQAEDVQVRSDSTILV